MTLETIAAIIIVISTVIFTNSICTLVSVVAFLLVQALLVLSKDTVFYLLFVLFYELFEKKKKMFIWV